eukprot:15441036-Alexandrium_andersonii.AAC.1
MQARPAHDDRPPPEHVKRPSERSKQEQPLLSGRLDSSSSQGLEVVSGTHRAPWNAQTFFNLRHAVFGSAQQD